MILPWMYAAFFLLMLLGFPIFILEQNPIAGTIIFILNLVLFACVTYSIHSPQLGAWRGLRLLCGSFMSGCGNITILYIFFVLFYYYIQAVLKTIQGIKKGRQFSQDWWLKTIVSRVEAGGWNMWKR